MIEYYTHLAFRAALNNLSLPHIKPSQDNITGEITRGGGDGEEANDDPLNVQGDDDNNVDDDEDEGEDEGRDRENDEHEHDSFSSAVDTASASFPSMSVHPTTFGSAPTSMLHMFVVNNPIPTTTTLPLGTARRPYTSSIKALEKQDPEEANRLRKSNMHVNHETINFIGIGPPIQNLDFLAEEAYFYAQHACMWTAARKLSSITLYLKLLTNTFMSECAQRPNTSDPDHTVFYVAKVMHITTNL